MKTPKGIGKAIIKKLRNLKDIAAPKETATQEPSASSSKDFLKEPEENILIVETATEQQTPVTTETCNSNITIEDQNTPIADNIETIEAVTQEPNTSDDPSPAEPCDAAEEKPSKMAYQPIVAGVVGAILLASGVALYVMKMPVVAAIVGIVGLACIGFALYNALKPDTKLEKVENVEQPIIANSSLNLT